MIRMLLAVVNVSIVLLTMSKSQASFAVSLKAINTGKNPMMQVNNSQTEKKSVRVRVAVNLQPFEKIIVRAANGQQTYQYRKTDAIKRVLRARIEETNHFYIDGWHIETIPQSWSNASRVLAMKMRFYKRYGINQELEEYVGENILKGYLTGKDYLYVLRGQTRSQFNDKFGKPVVEVIAGVPATQQKQPYVKKSVQPKAL